MRAKKWCLEVIRDNTVETEKMTAIKQVNANAVQYSCADPENPT